VAAWRRGGGNEPIAGQCRYVVNSRQSQHGCEDHQVEMFGVSGAMAPETPNIYSILVDL
jgi:hypothetical protein